MRSTTPASPSPQSPLYASPLYPSVYAPAQKTGMNTLAIVSFVMGFLCSIAAVACGHVALNQIKRTGESGSGLAVAGLVLGYVGVAFGCVWIILVGAAVASNIANGSI